MILVTGGSGSGKSAFAEERVLRLHQALEEAENTAVPLYYIATMQVYGEEGEKKVARHRRMRADKGFVTVEQFRDAAEALKKMYIRRVALLECVSNLTANEMFPEDEIRTEDAVAQKVTGDILRLAAETAGLVVVTNNVFEDGVPYDETTLAYIRALGKINRNLAAAAREVWEVAAGIPVCLKKGT